MSTKHEYLDGRLDHVRLLREFDSIAPVLEGFAAKHSLLIRRYLHNNPMWAFYFRHPKGGTGMLQFNLGLDESDGILPSTCGSWSVDDYASLTRSTMSLPLRAVSELTSSHVLTALTSTLEALLQADATSRTKVSRIPEQPVDQNREPIVGEIEKALRVPT